MVISISKTLKRHISDIIIVTIIGMIISFLFVYPIENWKAFLLISSSYSFLIGTILWKGNEFVGTCAWNNTDFVNRPTRAVIINILFMIIYSTVAIFLFNFLWIKLVMPNYLKFDSKDVLMIMIVQLGITIIISSVLAAIEFFNEWKSALIKKEQFKRESVELQYQALKNQVNPHFLFNSLNTVSNLIKKDSTKAIDFIQKFSDIYRYVLEHEKQEVVNIDEELIFTTRYLELQKLRHGNHLKYSVELEIKTQRFIVPMSLQMLVENAIKHNIISTENPLNIKIYNLEEYIIIENTLQKRSSVLKKEGGIGLKNLKERYQYFSDLPIIIEESKDLYVVKVPLLSYHQQNKS